MYNRRNCGRKILSKPVYLATQTIGNDEKLTEMKPSFYEDLGL